MSPHFGLMDESKMSREDALLLRAKLHWRGGIRRCRENQSAAGISSLYDAMLSAMRWYILTNLRDEAGKDVIENIENERFVFFLLRKAGLLSFSFDLNFMEDVVDKALMQEDIESRKDQFIEQVKKVMTQLTVLPFDESELPPEDPSTFRL
ncbi:MAG: hypothetical protein SCH71_14820 [Desulfobulbaceae bacterium]|nr:hypothetical protein [Desulfobulbaceae bacterium]